MKQELENFNDVQLWNLIKTNNDHAFSFIYENYSDDLYRYGQRFTFDLELIEDTIQDIFIKVWRNRSEINISKSIKLYLLSSFRREIILRVNNKRKFDGLEEISLSEINEESRQTQIIKKEIEEGKLELLNLSLEGLTKRQKEALHLKYIENLSYDQIAQLMGIQVPTLYNVIFRAIKILKEDFNKYSFKYKLSILICILSKFYS